jgi:hypothetical protein
MTDSPVARHLPFRVLQRAVRGPVAGHAPLRAGLDTAGRVRDRGLGCQE